MNVLFWKEPQIAQRCGASDEALITRKIIWLINQKFITQRCKRYFGASYFFHSPALIWERVALSMRGEIRLMGLETISRGAPGHMYIYTKIQNGLWYIN